MGSGSSSPKKSKKKSSSTGQIDPDDETMNKLFRKQSSEAKKRYQHQLYLAKESPTQTFDVSSCELSELPSEVMSLCGVLQKETLLCNNNWLSSLKGGGHMKDLKGIRVLDLHDNRISSLPDDIAELQCVQVINLENNKLKSLGHAIGRLKNLQTLNLKNNKLEKLPDTICDLTRLRLLDISRNKVNTLPSQLCQVRTLETINLDPDQMHYPPGDVCAQGTEAIMRFLCNENGIEYIPPTHFMLDVLDSPKPDTVDDSKSTHLKAQVVAISETVMQYEEMKEKRRQQQIALERQLEEEQRAQAELMSRANKTKDHIVQQIAKEQAAMESEIMTVQQNRESERKRLFATLEEIEMNSRSLVDNLLRMNEKARHTEELLEQMEKERMETEQWAIIRQEEIESLRKKDVLAAMQKILKESEEFEELLSKHFLQRELSYKKSMKGSEDSDERLSSVLRNRDNERISMIDKLMKEEELQKEAFEALQMQKDARHQRITSQIDLIQDELAQLTYVEMEQRSLRTDTQKNILEERRQALTDLMIQLLKERDQREEELKKRLIEMEESRDNTQTDYWLVQYQRLMDRKPATLMNQEHQLEHAVVTILQKAGATDYIPQFARRKISIETLCQMTMEDLTFISIPEGVRDRILVAVDEYKASLDLKARKKTKAIEEPEEKKKEEVSPGASPKSPTAPPTEVIARIAPECVVCVDSECNMVFLNCGHVCCCSNCSASLTECPLCRGEIVQRVKLSRGS